jgi:hypothetical protein
MSNTSRPYPCPDVSQDSSTYVLRNVSFNQCVGLYAMLDNCSGGPVKFHQTWGNDQTAIHFESAFSPGKCLSIGASALVACNLQDNHQWFSYGTANGNVLLQEYKGGAPGTMCLVADSTGSVSEQAYQWPIPDSYQWTFQ